MTAALRMSMITFSLQGFVSKRVFLLNANLIWSDSQWDQNQFSWYFKRISREDDLGYQVLKQREGCENLCQILVGLGGSSRSCWVMKAKADTSKIQSWLCFNYSIRNCNQNGGRRFCLEERNGESEICEVKDSVLSLKVMTEQIQAQRLKTYHE